MPTITDIKQQKRSAQRYSVYVDNHYAFALSDLDLSTSGLRPGNSISAEELANWQSHAMSEKGYQYALRLLSYRPRSQRELHDAMVRKEFEPDVIVAVQERLEGLGLLNDAAFAASWIASRQSLKPRSKRILERELMQKGLSRDTIVEALANVSGEDDLDVLVEMAQRKRRQSQYQDPQKLMAYLARQGFGYDQIKKALARLDEV